MNTKSFARISKLKGFRYRITFIDDLGRFEQHDFVSIDFDDMIIMAKCYAIENEYSFNDIEKIKFMGRAYV